jgi:pyruvate dehydrogenase complex dehydrogenase (E1) component
MSDARIVDATAGRLQLAHEGDHVLLRVSASQHDALPIYQVTLSTELAVLIAQGLVRHALAAGHGEPVTFTLGGHAP